MRRREGTRYFAGRSRSRCARVDEDARSAVPAQYGVYAAWIGHPYESGDQILKNMALCPSHRQYGSYAEGEPTRLVDF